MSKKYSNTKITVQSPGRINIIGEHTDYNDGFVLPAAIDKKTSMQLQKEDTTTAFISAQNVKETFTFDLNHFEPLSGGWQNYIMGVVHELQQLGANIQGFSATFGGDVPIGSGMSSSAALECSLAYGLNELFDLNLSNEQLIKSAQMAEHNFVGIKCGIMDQFASMMGKEKHALLLDCRSLAYQYFPMELGNYELLLLNTNVSHSLAESAYNQRRAECEQGVQILKTNYPNLKSLRDASLAELSPLFNSFSRKIYNRCFHVITENKRVLDATTALTTGNLQTLGRLMYQSHRSLRYAYDVSCIELDYLVENTYEKNYVLGSRMMGGGFGGCTINIVEKSKKDQFINEMSTQYRQQFGVELSPYSVAIADGTNRV